MGLDSIIKDSPIQQVISSNIKQTNGPFPLGGIQQDEDGVNLQ
jgi:hypothetical protein